MQPSTSSVNTQPLTDTLPSEIIQEIFQEISPNTDALKACTLVHRSWTIHTQKFLFTDLVVGKRPDGSNEISLCQRLLDVLDASPHLALHFRHITLILSPYSDVFPKQSQLLCQLLPQLCQVRSLVLHGRNLQFSTLLIDSISQMISNPLFESLELHNWSCAAADTNLSKLLNSCTPALRYLGLAGIDFSGADGGDVDNTLPLTLPGLEELRILMPTTFTHHQLFRLPKLSRIYWPIHRKSGNDGYCASLFTLAALPRVVKNWSFRIFSTTMRNGDAPLCRVLPLEILAAIRELTLSFESWGSADFALAALEYLNESIPESQLESITLNFLIEAPSGYIWDFSRWERVATALGPLMITTSPKRVSVVFKLGGWDEPIPPNPDVLARISAWERNVGTTEDEDEDEMYIDDVEMNGNVCYQVGKEVEKAAELMEARFAHLRVGGIFSLSTEYDGEVFIW